MALDPLHQGEYLLEQLAVIVERERHLTGVDHAAIDLSYVSSGPSARKRTAGLPYWIYLENRNA